MNETLKELELVSLCDGRQGVRKLVEVAVAKDGGPSGEAKDGAVLDFVASSGALDRYQEIIEPSGWRLDNYRRNPVFQNAHQYGDVIFTLGKAVVTEVRGGALYQRVAFAVEANPVARIAYNLYRGGFLNAVSVGFVPVRWENGSAESDFRRKYLEQELLEVSAVAVPANPEALALGVRSGAVTKGDVREALELLRTVLGVEAEKERQASGLMNLARELRGVLRRA